MLYLAVDVGTKYQVGIRSGTGITTIDNFTLLRAGKLLVASWESLWNFECNSTNRQPTVLKLRDNNTDNKPKVSAVEWASYRSWFLRYQRRNAAECSMAYWKVFDEKRRCIRSFSAGFSMLIRRATCDQRAVRMAVRKSVRKTFKADKTANLLEWA